MFSRKNELETIDGDIELLKAKEKETAEKAEAVSREAEVLQKQSEELRADMNIASQDKIRFDSEIFQRLKIDLWKRKS